MSGLGGTSSKTKLPLASSSSISSSNASWMSSTLERLALLLGHGGPRVELGGLPGTHRSDLRLDAARAARKAARDAERDGVEDDEPTDEQSEDSRL